MGYDVTCKASVGNQSSEGRAQLETDFVQFRSDSLRFKVGFKELSKVNAAGETLDLTFDGRRVKLHLGEKAAAKWADKILHPPSRLDKLGVKPTTSLCFEGNAFELAFTREVADNPSVKPSDADLVFLAALCREDLRKVVAIRKRLRQDAGLWIVYPKGRPEIREIDVIEAGRTAGLKDVKVMRFSDTETALKFVIPVDARKAK
jgi:hypothetical protein